MLRATLHPAGMLDLLHEPARGRDSALRRAGRQYDRTADPGLGELIAEIERYPIPRATEGHESEADDVVVPMRLRSALGDLSLLYATTVFGAPRDVTLDELAIETFLPADETTRHLLPLL